MRAARLSCLVHVACRRSHNRSHFIVEACPRLLFHDINPTLTHLSHRNYDPQPQPQSGAKVSHRSRSRPRPHRSSLSSTPTPHRIEIQSHHAGIKQHNTRVSQEAQGVQEDRRRAIHISFDTGISAGMQAAARRVYQGTQVERPYINHITDSWSRYSTPQPLSASST